MDDQIYSFLFKGLLTEESLNKAGRKGKTIFTDEEEAAIAQKLSLPFFDDELLSKAKKMALVYTAIFCFENSVREFVIRILNDINNDSEEDWWNKYVDKSVQKKVATRKEIDHEGKKWHSHRGNNNIVYTDLKDLIVIIQDEKNWEHFKPYLENKNWSENIFNTLQHSRNTIMHSGELEMQDIERIALCMKDWNRQVGY